MKKPKRGKVNRLKKITESKIEALRKEQEKTVETLIDAGSKERIEKDLELFVDTVLKYQPSKDSKDP